MTSKYPIYLGRFKTDKVKYPLLEKKDDYYDCFEDLTPTQIIEISQLEIIVAAYNKESYEGDAFILFRKDGKLYEVNAQHCSCHGLNKWEPEETTKEALLMRSNDYGVWKYYGERIKHIIDGVE